MTKPVTDRLLMPAGDAARYLCTSRAGLEQIDVKPKMHPVRKIPVYDRRDLDDWAAALPYVGEGGSDDDPANDWKDLD